MDIDKENTLIHNYICEKYSHRFPELNSFVHHPIDCHIVWKIGDNIQLTLDGVEGLLPSALMRVASITAFMSPGKPLVEMSCSRFSRHVIMPLILIHQV